MTGARRPGVVAGVYGSRGSELRVRVSPLTGRFENDHLEAGFRAGLWPEWSRRLAIVTWLAALLVMAMCYMDYRVLGFGAPLYAAWGARLMFFVTAIALVQWARRRENAAWLDAAALALMLLLSTLILVIVALEHKGILPELPSTLLALVAFYLFVPARFTFQFAAALYLSAGFLAAQAAWGPSGGVEYFAAAMQIVVCNLLGAYTSLNGHKSRRREWLMLQTVQQRERFEELIANQSTRFISLPVTEFDEGIHATLGEIGEFAGADRSYVFQWDLAGRTVSCTHEWCRPGVPAGLRHLQAIPYDEYTWGVNQLQRGEMILARSLDDLPPEAGPERALCEKYSARSLVVVPLKFSGTVIGSVGFQSVGRELELTPDLIAMLRMVGDMIVNVLMRRRVENELRQKTQALQHTVQALQESNTDLQQFAYAASHDLQEPLRGISSFSSLLVRQLGSKLDEKSREYLHYLTGSAQRMEGLVTGLLTYSRVDGKSRPHTVCDSDAVVADAVSNLKTSIDETGATLHCEPLLPVRGDPALLQQLFQNLIGNAIKFHGDHAPSVHVSCRPRGRKIEFAVTDNGIGVEPRFANKIFQVFTRLNTVDRYPGHGIGLAVCKRIVARHQGHLWFEPNRPQGSIFHFTLPAAD